MTNGAHHSLFLTKKIIRTKVRNLGSCSLHPCTSKAENTAINIVPCLCVSWQSIHIICDMLYTDDEYVIYYITDDGSIIYLI